MTCECQSRTATFARMDELERIASEWAASLEAWPEVKLAWIEGSVARGVAVPGADLDLCLAIDDSAMERIWTDEREALLASFGERLTLIDDSWIRFLTASGVVVEIEASPVSRLEDLRLNDWRFIHCKLPEVPTVTDIARSAPLTWPSDVPVTPELVREVHESQLYRSALLPAAFHNNERCSASMLVDVERYELMFVMYHRLGLRQGRRYRHLSIVLPAPFLEDLESTRTRPNEGSLDLGPLARASVRLSLLYQKHIRALGEQAGGGYDEVWADRIHTTMVANLGPFLELE